MSQCQCDRFVLDGAEANNPPWLIEAEAFAIRRRGRVHREATGTECLQVLQKASHDGWVGPVWLDLVFTLALEHLPVASLQLLQPYLASVLRDVDRRDLSRIKVDEVALAQGFLRFAQGVERASEHGENCRIVFELSEILRRTLRCRIEVADDQSLAALIAMDSDAHERRFESL